MKRSPLRVLTREEKAAKRAASTKVVLPGEEKARKEKEKAAKKRKRVARVRKTAGAIKNVESQRLLKRSEVLVLLDRELSRVCRERDACTCFVTGRYCLPGICADQGCAAHLIPRQDLPFQIRYSPDAVVWMIGTEHAKFDGRTQFKSMSANQAYVWGKLAREKPEVFELLTGTDWKHQPRETVSIHDLRAKLEELRLITYI